MNNLTRYIDWYIRSQISISHEWKKLEVIFSNEKVPGEGEHKIINYLRKYKRIGESCCIHGMDADLIMLSLASPCENIYLLRDDSFNLDLSHVVDLGSVRKELQKRLVNEGAQVLQEVNDLQEGLKETVKAVAEELNVKTALINKAIKVAHKGDWHKVADEFEDLETLVTTVGKDK